jgi:hypothetical protein
MFGYVTEELLEALEVDMEGDRIDIATIGESVNSDAWHALITEPADQRLKMFDVAVNVSVRKQADQVKAAALGLRSVHKPSPRFTVEEGAGCNGLGDQLCSLFEDPSRADRVVADLRISHVAVARQADGRAVRLQRKGHRSFCQDPIEVRSGCEIEGVPLVPIGSPSVEADTVEDYEKELTWNAATTWIRLKLKIRHLELSGSWNCAVTIRIPYFGWRLASQEVIL